MKYSVEPYNLSHVSFWSLHFKCYQYVVYFVVENSFSFSIYGFSFHL